MIKFEHYNGHCIFCEDIRFEIDGKVTFVGAYQAVMNVNIPFPIVFPKFGFFVSYVEDRNTLSGPIVFRISFEGNEIPASVLFESSFDRPTDDGIGEDKKKMHVSFPVIFTQLQLAGEGKLTVTVQVGEQLSEIGTLVVQKGQTPLES